MKLTLLAAFAALTLTAAPAVSQTVVNSAPTGGFTYGNGNNYTPANAVVTSNTATNSELAVRFHEYQQPAGASDANGLYTFSLGTILSFDYSIGSIVAQRELLPLQSGASIFLTNLLTGQTANYNPFQPDNTLTAAGDTQNSARLTFASLAGLGFNANVNNTYRIDLSQGGNVATAFAQVGTGAVAAVPEPATWAMMLMGFGAVGFSVRRNRRKTLVAQMA